ncbi:MAG: acetyl-CoA acetyltransferase [Acidimicrobiaceae bacterium]|nr:acetyl-CoA acetyltransferase [Acidimicrobiaceae bacterium]
MTNPDARSPVIVGVGQYKQKLDDVTSALEQYRLMEEAVRLAAQDAGCSTLLQSIDQMIVIGGMWGYPDPGQLIADAVGSPEAKTFLSAMGGNMPQACVSEASELISANKTDVVVITGGEAVYSKNKLKKLGLELSRTGQELDPATPFGKNIPMSSEHERERGFFMPTQIYALFESAIRASLGESQEGHRNRIAALWEKFNKVAVSNPYAWVRSPMTAEEIKTASPTNRMVGYPYTKSMNANSFVDYGGAIIVCSVEKAETLGVSRDRWIFPYAATDGHASYLFSERDNFYESPAIRITGKRCFELAGISVDDIGPMDLYSCFPSCVQLIMKELDITSDRIVTTTGGLPFFGGPMNSYVIHAIASTVDAIRETGEMGYVHANGGYATKQACGIYGSSPPSEPFKRDNVQTAIDQYPIREVDKSPEGRATIEAYTVMHGREGPERALISTLMDDGRRALASSEDESMMLALMKDEYIGNSIDILPNGAVGVLAK